MKLRTYLLFLPLLLSFSACGQTNGHYVRVNTITEVFFSQDSILNIVTTDSTFVDTVGVGGSTGGGQLESLDVAKRSSTSTQAVTGNWVAIPLQTEVISGQGITYDGANQTRLTVDADGVYWVGGYVTVLSQEQRPQTVVQIRVNGVPVGNNRGSAYIRNTGLSWDYWVMEVANTPLVLSAGDYVQFYVAQVVGPTYTPSGSAAVTLEGANSEFWVAKLVGAAGAQGTPGSNGTDGLSAYEIWLSQGNTGTEADFIASLQGEPGPAGGPVGPPGPAGESITSDTATTGSYWRLFTTDNAGPDYTNVALDGGGVEFYSARDDEKVSLFNDFFQFRMQGAVDLIFDFPSVRFSDLFIASDNNVDLGGSNIKINVEDSVIAVVDGRITKKGLEYFADYSDDLKLNDRSIPDVGTVQGMIDAGGGGSPPIPEFIESLTSFTVNAVPHSSYVLRSENAGIKVLTLNKGVMQPGDWIIINQGSTFNADDCRIDASDGMRFHLVAGVTTSQTFGFGSTMMFVWDGTNWLVTYTD